MKRAIKIPSKVNGIIKKLEENGFEAYAVGGCVRDCILGKEPKDWDITTSAKPEEIKHIFKRTVDTGIQHGTVTVLAEKEGFEVTTYRLDGKYEDGRHPKEVIFTSNLREDLKRRDFTINAMAYNERTGLVDLFDGLLDMDRRLIRCVGKPEERFEEDALRILRAVRFSAQLDFDIEKKTREGIAQFKNNLSKISSERIYSELTRLLVSGQPEKLKIAYETGITSVILPEFDEMMKTEQKNKNHLYSVGEHTLKSLKYIEGDSVLRWTMLLHDVAKPAVCVRGEDGTDRFPGHGLEGEKMAKAILRRLKSDNYTIQKTMRLVRWHEYYFNVDERGVRHAIHRIGEDIFEDFIKVQRADVLAQSEFYRKEKLESLEKMERLLVKIRTERQCVSLKMLAINGKDLISAGIKPGKEMGEILEKLLNLVLDHPEWNKKEILMERIKKEI